MIIHIGGDCALSLSDIVCLLNVDCVTPASPTQAFLDKLGRMGRMIDLSDGKPKSYVIAMKKQMQFVYVSPVSALTLQGRTERYGKDF